MIYVIIIFITTINTTAMKGSTDVCSLVTFIICVFLAAEKGVTLYDVDTCPDLDSHTRTMNYYLATMKGLRSAVEPRLQPKIAKMCNIQKHDQIQQNEL